MKSPILILMASILWATAVFAENDHGHVTSKSMLLKENMMMKNMAGHQEKMHKKMVRLNTIMKKLEDEKNPDKRAKLLQQHTELMEEGLYMIKEMRLAAMAERKACYKADSSGPSGEACFEIESHEDTQANMVVMLMEHLMKRQSLMQK